MKVGSKDQSTARQRRLQRLQLVAVIVPTVAILVASILMGRSVANAGDGRRELQDANRSLVESRHTIQAMQAEYWARRALDSASPGITPAVQQMFMREITMFGQLVRQRQHYADERAVIDEVQASLGTITTVVLSGVLNQTGNQRKQDAAVQRARANVAELDRGLTRWAGILNAKLLREGEQADRLISKILVGLGVLITLLVSVATAMFVTIDRKRRAAIAEVQAERDANDAVMASVQDGLAVLDEDGVVVQTNERLTELTGLSARELEGSPAPWINEVPERFQGEADITFAASDGGSRHLLLSASPLAHGRGVLHVLKDVTSRRAAEAELHNLSVEREVLRRVATFVAGGAEPSAVFDLVACETATLLGADAAVVTRFELQTDRTIDVGVWVDPGRPAERPPSRVPLDGGSPTALVFQTGRPARVDDFSAVDAISGDLLIERGYRCGAAAPVQVGSVRWGAVAVLGHDRKAFAPGVEDRLARFAELVGLTVANADARARLASQAATDPLTGLANHRSFHERLEAEVARARHDQTDLALVMIDLDNFKEVNDTFGHHAGDAVLSEAARRLAGEARFGEIVARVGGEEFAWILPGSDGLNAWRAAERARQAVAEAPFADGVGSITASAGVADLHQASDAATLMRLADGALYWAKASGRDATFRYSPDVVRELSASERAERLAKTQAVTALRALARAVDAKDPSTARHAERVANVAVRIGRRLGWEPDRLELLREAALLHDVGKIGVPDSLLFKPDRLTGAEKQQVEAHAALGAEIVSDVLTPEQVTWVRGHHERWDGLGYPDRISGDNLAAGARIISVADAWDAMTSVRTYGRTREGSEAAGEIAAESGRQFCPLAAAAMIDLWNEGMLEDDPITGRTASQSSTQ